MNFKGKDYIGLDLPLLPSNITTLSLNYNNLSTLEGIEAFTNLKNLYINYNKISQFTELLRIPNKAALVKLGVQGNSILSIPDIYINIASTFPKYIFIYLNVVWRKSME